MSEWPGEPQQSDHLLVMNRAASPLQASRPRRLYLCCSRVLATIGHRTSEEPTSIRAFISTREVRGCSTQHRPLTERKHCITAYEAAPCTRTDHRDTSRLLQTLPAASTIYISCYGTNGAGGICRVKGLGEREMRCIGLNNSSIREGHPERPQMPNTVQACLQWLLLLLLYICINDPEQCIKN
jgi:hypothetical protein